MAVAIADGDGAANIADWCIVLEMLKLCVKLLHNSRLGLRRPGFISNSRAYLW
jgi:hypothetical protein